MGYRMCIVTHTKGKYYDIKKSNIDQTLIKSLRIIVYIVICTKCNNMFQLDTLNTVLPIEIF